jgi:hypothetical protein
MRKKSKIACLVVGFVTVSIIAGLLYCSNQRQEELDKAKLSAAFSLLQPFSGLMSDSEISTEEYAKLDDIMCYVGPSIVKAMEDNKITRSEYNSIWALYRGDEKKKKNLIETVEECRRNQ